MRYVLMAYYWSWEYIWWLQPVSTSISERCPYVGSLNYEVILKKISGERVDQKVVSSNNCSAGLCSTSFFPHSSDQNYLVSVSANNVFGLSNIITSNIISEFNIATLPTWNIYVWHHCNFLQIALFHLLIILHLLLRAAYLQSSAPLSWMREDVSFDMVRILHTKT